MGSCCRRLLLTLLFSMLHIGTLVLDFYAIQMEFSSSTPMFINWHRFVCPFISVSESSNFSNFCACTAILLVEQTLRTVAANFSIVIALAYASFVSNHPISIFSSPSNPWFGCKGITPENSCPEKLTDLNDSSSRIDLRTPAIEPRRAEWKVLYTTQITQKAKKFHDGFLQLVAHG
ncbi:hypothetical protein BUALT_BualtUnG0033500 [Buddleja alternifolia]|uniref:5'-3' DNA helicase ZGRF1-like N-terminal domain-containing protein n=1 Tax=Buddleja alternifolia TaxID=168488 RepID=A0AAV6W587_9LAMI|nr:hypothetical protein BUALT_BualtUnG0033500 [Buddleja alternifolia]